MAGPPEGAGQLAGWRAGAGGRVSPGGSGWWSARRAGCRGRVGVRRRRRRRRVASKLRQAHETAGRWKEREGLWLANTGQMSQKRRTSRPPSPILSLLIGPAAAARLVKAMRKERTLQHYAAKDILRAAGLPLLGSDDSEVSADLEKVKLGKKLSPVLLVRGTRCGSLTATTGSARATASMRRLRYGAGWPPARPRADRLADGTEKAAPDAFGPLPALAPEPVVPRPGDPRRRRPGLARPRTSAQFPPHRTRLLRQKRFRDPQKNDRSVRRTRPANR
jgi:hypothetical protein